MTRRTALVSLALGAASCARWIRTASASSLFVAFSMREARRRLEAVAPEIEIASLGGMTRVLGLIHDRSVRDLIVVGRVRPGQDPIALDDFVAAIRALLLRKQFPLLSIDKTPETSKTGRQVVRAEGTARGEPFTAQLFAADMTLKKAALGLPAADNLPLRSFFHMCIDAARQGGWAGHVSSRLWFHPLDASLLVREDVVAIRELRVGVRTEVPGGAEGARDEISHAYAAAFTANFDRIVIDSRFLEVRRLRNLFDLVALAHGLESFSDADVSYWIEKYPMPEVTIPEEVELLRREARVEIGGRTLLLEVDGGVDTKLRSARLREGDHIAFRTAVLRSRPDREALVWRVPLAGWRFRREADDEADVVTDGERVLGTYLERRLYDAPVSGGRVVDPRGGVTADVIIDPRDFRRKP